MGRGLDEIVGELPADQQAAIEERFHALKQEVEGLLELRRVAGKAKADMGEER